MKNFEFIINSFINPEKNNPVFYIFNASEQFNSDRNNTYSTAMAINSAFLICLTGHLHPEYNSAKKFINVMMNSSEYSELASFYLNGIEYINNEVTNISKDNIEFKNSINSLVNLLSDENKSNNIDETREKIWSVFFPEAGNILSDKIRKIKSLREKRIVTITQLNDDPVTDPERQILFTSNVLLTVPPLSKSSDDLFLTDDLYEQISKISDDQVYWYDHPIQIGVEPEKNEILYGLKGLEQTVQFEKDSGNISKDIRIKCLLSVSVTHCSLHKIAKDYIEHVLSLDNFHNIDLYVFTEINTAQIIEDIILPAADYFLQKKDSLKDLEMFGVDGEYGRHYSFLKAVSAFWNVLIDPDVKATFKIDLDQIFPQEKLIETGSSAFNHFKTLLWGAKGIDSNGNLVDMSMIAGALVNENDIDKSLFTPDVKFPNKKISFDEYIFFSTLPQALSTEAEMMVRYNDEYLDGKTRCLQRIHVTGGTNGILVNCLNRYRPFTPSFIGRAEDQAYILSVLNNTKERLAYLHKDGLIMRHDKYAFAQESIESANTAKIIGDYIRILLFSSYSEIIGDLDEIKDVLDPFTGCFISRIPVTLVFLRFAFKAASLFNAGDHDAMEFLNIGVKRITETLNFAYGQDNKIKMQYQKEKKGWNIYYDVLLALENGLKNNDSFALDLKEKAKSIINDCNISFVEEQ